jgi:hypothetical protein
MILSAFDSPYHSRWGAFLLPKGRYSRYSRYSCEDTEASGRCIALWEGGDYVEAIEKCQQEPLTKQHSL